MPEPQICNTLRAKVADIEHYIAQMEQRIDDARRDLAHIQATLLLFRRNEEMPHPVYMGLTRIFRRGEITRLGLEALRASPAGLDTREITAAVIAGKGLDVDDKVFRKSLAQSIVTLFGRLELRGQVRCLERRKGVKVWAAEVHSSPR